MREKEPAHKHSSSTVISQNLASTDSENTNIAVLPFRNQNSSICSKTVESSTNIKGANDTDDCHGEKRQPSDTAEADESRRKKKRLKSDTSKPVDQGVAVSTAERQQPLQDTGKDYKKKKTKKRSLETEDSGSNQQLSLDTPAKKVKLCNKPTICQEPLESQFMEKRKKQQKIQLNKSKSQTIPELRVISKYDVVLSFHSRFWYSYGT